LQTGGFGKEAFLWVDHESSTRSTHNEHSHRRCGDATALSLNWEAGAVDELNPIRRAWSDGRPAFGVWASIPSPLSVEFAARGGVDYVCIDLQHGLGSFDSLSAQITACWAAGAAPIVRPHSNETWQIGKALDLGALAVIVPLVSDAAAATAAVSACRYPPVGTRSHGPLRIAGIVGSDDPRTLEREALCFVMVETREGLDQVEQIAATPGLDGIYIGPADLAISLGLAPSAYATSSEHAAAVEHIRAACEAAGIASGMHCHSGAEAHARVAQGFQVITVATDSPLLRDSVARELATARGTAA
jgi:4-hydroxy-2-oxoheptanedioate aldolase